MKRSYQCPTSVLLLSDYLPVAPITLLLVTYQHHICVTIWNVSDQYPTKLVGSEKSAFWPASGQPPASVEGGHLPQPLKTRQVVLFLLSWVWSPTILNWFSPYNLRMCEGWLKMILHKLQCTSVSSLQTYHMKYEDFGSRSRYPGHEYVIISYCLLRILCDFNTYTCPRFRQMGGTLDAGVTLDSTKLSFWATFSATWRAIWWWTWKLKVICNL